MGDCLDMPRGVYDRKPRGKYGPRQNKPPRPLRERCRRGHLLDEVNGIVTHDGYIACRQCKNDARRKGTREVRAPTMGDIIPLAMSVTVVPLRNAVGTVRPLCDIEAEAIAHAVTHCRGLSQAARLLKIGRSTLYRKLMRNED